MKDEKAEVCELLLTRLQVAKRQMVTDDLLDDMKIDVIADWMLGGIVVEFRKYILKETLEEVKKTVKHPADWWQAFKERWFPASLWMMGAKESSGTPGSHRPRAAESPNGRASGFGPGYDGSTPSSASKEVR